MATAVELQTEAQELRTAARAHQRAARRHRNHARDLMTRMSEVIEAAARQGITITVDNAKPKGPSNASSKDQRAA